MYPPAPLSSVLCRRRRKRRAGGNDYDYEKENQLENKREEGRGVRKRGINPNEGRIRRVSVEQENGEEDGDWGSISNL